jgi:GH24 family phage-related lysozyme (muramidase)
MNIPDKESHFKLPDPPKPPGGAGKSGAGQALGAAKSLMGLASLIPGVGAVTGPLGAVMGAGEALAGAAGGMMVAGGRRRRGKRKGLSVGGQGEGVDFMSKTRQVDPEIADIADSWSSPHDDTGNQGAGSDNMSEYEQGRRSEHQGSVNNETAPLTTSANTGLAGQGVDYMSQERQGREPELRSSVHPAMSASNATPEEQNAYLMQHVPRERLHEVMTPAALAKAYPPTEAPARGELSPTWKPADVVIPTPGGGESPLATDLGGTSRPLQHGAEPIADVDAGGAPTVGLAAGERGSGFAEKPNLGSAEFPTAAFPNATATPEEAAAALREATSPEGRAHTQAVLAKRVADLQATREARENEEYGNKSLLRKVGEATGMIAPTRGLVPDAEKEAAAHLNAPVSPLDNDPETRVAGPNTTIIPSNTNDKVAAPAPGLGAAETPTAVKTATEAPDSFTPKVTPGVGAGAFPMTVSPTGVTAPAAAAPAREPDLQYLAEHKQFPLSPAPIGGDVRAPAAAPAPAPARVAPRGGVAPTAPAGGAARAPTPPNDANGNPIEQFFGGIARGVDGALHNVADFFTGGARNVGNTINSAGQVVNRAGQAIGQTVNSAGQAIGNEVHGRFNELMNGSPKMMSPGGNFHAQGVDPRLVSNLTEATRGLPQGWHAQFESGFRQGDKRQHGRGNAVDVALYNEKGERLANYQDPTTFRAYEKFAQDFRAAQQHNNPELNSATRWGGYFSGKTEAQGGPYGAVDLMHFDLGGRQGLGMLGGSWEGGMTAKQHALFPGATSVGMGQRPPEGYSTAVSTDSTGARTDATGRVSPGYSNGVQGILSQEEAFRGQAYFDKNASGSGGHWAVGYGSHKMRDPNTGEMREVRQGDTITPQGAQQDMTHRMQNEYLPAAVRKAGGVDVWRALPRNVRDGLGSTIWNYGHLPDPVAAAIRHGGGPNEIANAVAGLGGKTPAARARRAREAAHIRGGG